MRVGELLSRGVKPIQQRFLEPNYLFAMEWRDGWLFGRVLHRRICNYKPWPLIDSNGDAVSISASSSQEELRFRDPNNTENDILYLDVTTKAGWPWFFHGAIGIKPQYVNAYLRIPETQDIPGKFPSLDPVRPSAGHDVGYINSLVSPYDNPTDFLEIIIPPQIHIGAEYYNKDSANSHRPEMNLLFALYWFQVLTPSENATLIRKIALREVPAAFFKVGVADFPLEMGDTLKTDWKAELMTLEQASRL